MSRIEPFCLGIIDLGTNSIRLDIYRVDTNLSLSRLCRFKEMIRMGEGVFKRGFIREEVMLRALLAFDEIYAHLREYHVSQVVAFATCALRSAANSREFIQKVKQRTGVNISVITGEQEASLIAKAILNNEKTPPGYFGLIDIGGGSTELSLCYKNKVLDSYSLELGSIRLQQKFFEHTGSSANAKALAAQKLRECVRSVMCAKMKQRKWPNVKSVIGSSGTIRSLWKILKKSGKPVDPFKANLLSKLVRKILPMTNLQISRIHGVEEKRADIIVPGALLLDELLTLFGVENIYVTNCSLRDGILDWQMENLVQLGHLLFSLPKKPGINI